MTNNDNGREEKMLVLVNAAKDPTKKQYSLAVFEDAEGNRYEYSFSANIEENTRSQFYRDIAPFAYLPTLQDKNNKKFLKIRFRKGKMKLNPLNGKHIYQMLYPSMVYMEKEEEQRDNRKR